MPLRFLLLAAGASGLVGGLWLGLVRVGAQLPLAGLSPMDHGPLMVSGFLGTVIALERAVALRRPWGYLAPAFNAAGSVVTLCTSSLLGPLLLTLGSVGVLAILVRVVVMDRALHHLVMTAAAASWVLGNALLLLGRPVFELVVWWVCFLVLTIAGERLELNRLLRPSLRSRALFVGLTLGLLLGAGVALWDRDLGFRLAGAACLGLAGWLLVHDVARRTVKQQGAVRFIAVSLLGGYLWLALAGALALWHGNPAAGPVYDALLHAVFVGFVFSMIFGHALVIVPAVLGVRVTYKPRFYAHLGLLHLSLGLRLVGNLAGVHALRSGGAWLNTAAVALFLLSTVAAASLVRSSAKPALRSPGPPG